MPIISIITPCYFNETNIEAYGKAMIENEHKFPCDVEFEYILVDDGSKDATWEEMEKFQHKFPAKVKLVKLVRNFGSTNAVFSALPYCSGDCNVIISADLQDPPELIAQMYEHWLKGYKLVLANRSNREEPIKQKIFSNTFHWLIKKFGLKNLPDGGFDMNLFDREIRDILIKIDDKNSFFPHLLIWLGYEFVSVPYVRRKRLSGKSGYTLSKKLKAFIDSFVAFSFFPIRLISVLGLVLGVIAFIYGILVIAFKLMGQVDAVGWSSLMIVILFVSSFQMIAIGILGEYVWRAVEAARRRPNFIIDKTVGVER